MKPFGKRFSARIIAAMAACFAGAGRVLAACFAGAGAIGDLGPTPVSACPAPPLTEEDAWRTLGARPRGCGRSGAPHPYVARIARSASDHAAMARAEAKRSRRAARHLRELAPSHAGGSP